ncbi:MAG: DUF2059 domain-containing protein [Candidatus Cloacimonetes bacterium]|nr:DUF2059 domain-containing protein [Candidatus Cloacimonadota bacterium]
MKNILILSFFFTSISFSAGTDQKTPLIKKILKKIYKKKMIEQQQQDLFTRIESNITKGNNLLFDDLMEWEKNTQNIEAKYKLFKQLEKKSLKILKSRFLKEINMYSLVLKANMHLYRKNFTLSELKTLLKFYNTAAGVKTIEIAPQLLATSQEIMAKQLVPATSKIAKEVQKNMVEEFIASE